MNFGRMFERYLLSHVTEIMDVSEESGGLISVGSLSLKYSEFQGESDTEGVITFDGIHPDQVYTLLEDFVGVRNRQKRHGDATIIEKVLRGEETGATILFSGGVHIRIKLVYEDENKLAMRFAGADLEKNINRRGEMVAEVLLANLVSFLKDYCESISFLDHSLVPDTERSSASKTGSEDLEEREEDGQKDEAGKKDEGVGGGDEEPAEVIANVERENQGELSGEEGGASSLTTSTGSHPKMFLDEAIASPVQVDVGIDGQIDFSISSQRPKTEHGRRQASHIIAYILYVKAVLASMDGQYIHEVPGLLLSLAKHVLNKAQFKELYEDIDEYVERTKMGLSRTERKAVTKELRRKYVSVELVEKIKWSIKYTSSSLVASLVREMSGKVLEIINAEEDVAYVRTLKLDSATLGREGARIRNAVEGLRAIQEIIRICLIADPSDKREAYISLAKSPIRHGLRNFVVGKRVGNRNMRALMSAIEVCDAVEEAKEIKAEVDGDDSGEREEIASVFIPGMCGDRPSEGAQIKKCIRNLPEDTRDKISDLIYDFFDMDYFEYMASALSVELNKANEEKSKEGEYLRFEEIRGLIELVFAENPIDVVNAFHSFNEINVDDKQEENNQSRTTVESEGFDLHPTINSISEELDTGNLFVRVGNDAQSLLLGKIRKVFDFAFLSFPELESISSDDMVHIKCRINQRILKEQHWEEVEGLNIEKLTQQVYNPPLGFGAPS